MLETLHSDSADGECTRTGLAFCGRRVQSIVRVFMSSRFKIWRFAMQYHALFSALVIGCFLSMISATSEAFSITPGKWQFDYRSRSSFSQQPQEKTETPCVKETDWDPVKSISGSGNCQVSDIKHDSTSFKGEVSCSRGKGVPPMTGSMEYTSTGSTMTGRTVFKGEGYSMEMHTTGKHLGECE